MSILEKFTVIDRIKTRSESVATVSDNCLKFNIQTAQEMHYVPYIQVLINPKEKQFAIRACKEAPPTRCRSQKRRGEQKYTLKINAAAVTDVIRKMANWTAGDNWNVPGIYFAEENAIVYDVSTAFRPVPKGGGWAVKRQRDAALAETSVTDMSEEVDG